jgi:hypothetical protein
MSENSPSAPRPLRDADLDAVSGGYGWLSNPLQEARDRIARENPDHASHAGVSVSELAADVVRQQMEDRLRAAMGDAGTVAAMMDI